MITKKESNGYGSNQLTDINKVAFRGQRLGHNPTADRSKLGTKRHILTDKNGVPLSSDYDIPASTHDIKAVTEMLLIIQLSHDLLYHLSQKIEEQREESSISIYSLI